MVWRLKRRGMPTGSLEEALQWRREHLIASRLKAAKRGTTVNVLPGEAAMVNVSGPSTQPPAAEPAPPVVRQPVSEAVKWREEQRQRWARGDRSAYEQDRGRRWWDR